MVLNKNKSKKVIEESSTESESEQDSCQDYSEEEGDQYSESEEECSSSEQEESSSEFEEESEDEKPKKKINKKKNEPMIEKSIMGEILFMIPFESFNKNIIKNTIDSILLGATDNDLFTYFDENNLERKKSRSVIATANENLKSYKMITFNTNIIDSRRNILKLSRLNIKYKYSENNEDNKYFEYFSVLSLCFGKYDESVIAALVHLKTKNRFFCEYSDEKKKNMIYYYSKDTNYWKLDKENTKIRTMIETITHDVIEDLYIFYSNIIDNEKIISAINKNIESNKKALNLAKSKREIIKNYYDISDSYGSEISSKYIESEDLQKTTTIIKMVDIFGEEKKDFEVSKKKEIPKELNNKKEEIPKDKRIELHEPTKVDSIYQFYPNITKNFDKINPHIVAFSNLIYDFRTNEARKAKPTELIFTHLDYKYEDINNEINTSIEYIKNECLFPILNTQKEVNYVMFLFSKFLVDECPNSQNFYVFKGTGRNGKSLLLSLLESTLSVYSETLGYEYFDAKKGGRTGTGTDQTLASLVGKRIALTSEIPDNVEFTLNVTLLKNVTGRDKVAYRKLFGEKQSSKFNFIPIILTNKNIDFSDSHDGQGVSNSAIMDRLESTTFCNSFREKKYLVEGDQFTKLKNPELAPELAKKKYAIAFFHMLKAYFFKLQNNGFEIDETPVSGETKKQLLNISSDNFDDFIKEIVVRSADKTGRGGTEKIKVTNLFDVYDQYCNGNPDALNAKNFKLRMTDMLKYNIVQVKGYPYYSEIKYVDNYQQIINERIDSQINEDKNQNDWLEKCREKTRKDIKKATGNNTSNSSTTTSTTPKTNDRTNTEISEPECDSEGNFEPDTDTKNKKKNKNVVRVN